MDNKLFFIVLNKEVLKNLIFQQINFINTKILKGNSIKWDQIKDDEILLAAFGYQELFIKRMSLTKRKFSKEMGREIVRNNSIEMYHYVVERYRYYSDYKDSLNAIRFGYLEMSKILYSINPENYSKGCYLKLLIHNLDVVKWLTDIFDKEVELNPKLNGTRIKNYWCAVDRACQIGRLNMVKYLMERGNLTFDQLPESTKETSLVKRIIIGGNHEILQWFHNEKGLKFSSADKYKYSTMDLAVKIGSFDMLKTLHQFNIGNATVTAMDKSVKLGLEAVQWLHNNRTEGCSGKAMKVAAYRGNMEIVKWIHENRTEPCDKMLMTGAVVSENLELIKWFHENRTEGPRENIIDSAAKTNVEIVKWLHETFGYTIKPQPKTLYRAVKYNRLDIVRYLYENRIEEFDIFKGNEDQISLTIIEAINVGNHDLLLLILNSNPEWKSIIDTDINKYLFKSKEFENDFAEKVFIHYKNNKNFNITF